MNCPNCDKPLEEGQTICTACAEPKEAPEMELNTPEKEAPKKKMNWKPLIIGAVAVIAVVLALVLCWNLLFGPSTPQEYLVKAETTTLQKGNVSNVYDAVRSNATEVDAKHASTTLSVSFGDGIPEAVSSLIGSTGAQIDLGWLEQILLRVDTNVQDEAAQLDMAVGLNSVDILTLRVIMDLAEEAGYVGIPELSDTYFAAYFEDLGLDLDALKTSMETSTAASESMQALMEKLPDSKKLSKLVGKYLELATAQIEDVEQEKDTLKVGDYSQKVTVLTAEINEETAVNMAIAMLEALQDDEDVEEILEAVCDYVNEVSEMVGEETSVSPDDILNAIPDLIDELKAMESFSEEAITYTVYVGKGYEVVGREITDLNGNGFYHKTAHEGKEFASELAVTTNGEAVFAIYGKGTDSDATYEFVTGGSTVYYLDVIGLNTKKLDNGELNGTFRVRLGEALAQQLASMVPSEIGSLIGLADPALQMTLGDNSYELGLYTGDKTLVTIKLETKSLKESKISAPKDTVEVSGMGDEDMMDALADFNFEKLLDNLDEAGLPSEFLNLLESILGNL